MMPTMIRTGVIAALAELVGRPAEQISDEDNLIDDLGVDSRIAVSLLSRIEVFRTPRRLPIDCAD